MTDAVRGYVLAGGRSSRMGVDKAELRLGGRSLLEIAVAKLQLASGGAEVAVVGDGRRAPEGVRVIDDLRPGFGPVGGMAAALADLGTGLAMFLPVDMPMIPEGLMRALVEDWMGSGRRVCYPVVDGVAQPLVSLVGAEMREEFAAALERGELRARLLLDRCAAMHGGARRSEIGTLERELVWPGWIPDEATWRRRSMWFSNLNTPEQFAEAERLVVDGASVGSAMGEAGWENGAGA